MEKTCKLTRSAQWSKKENRAQNAFPLSFQQIWWWFARGVLQCKLANSQTVFRCLQKCIKKPVVVFRCLLLNKLQGNKGHKARALVKAQTRSVIENRSSRRFAPKFKKPFNLYKEDGKVA